MKVPESVVISAKHELSRRRDDVAERLKKFREIDDATRKAIADRNNALCNLMAAVSGFDEVKEFVGPYYNCHANGETAPKRVDVPAFPTLGVIPDPADRREDLAAIAYSLLSCGVYDVDDYRKLSDEDKAEARAEADKIIAILKTDKRTL